MLNPTEWDFRQGGPTSVDPAHAGFDLGSHFTGVGNVGTKDGVPKAVARVVSNFNGFFFGLVR